MSLQSTDSTTSPTFRAMIAQLAEELGVQIINGVLSSEHIHLFVSIPPHIAVSEFVRRTKGRSFGIRIIIFGVAAIFALLVVM